MTFDRLSLFIAAIGLCSCMHSPVSEPPEFQLSIDALKQQYPAARTSGAAHLFANEIVTTRDEFGRETHHASGGALLIKDSNPPIQAKASTIVITPAFAEALGKATVKKDDRLYIGKEESTKIIIDGTAIKPEGPHLVRKVATAIDKPAESETGADVIDAPPPPVVEPKPVARHEPPKAKERKIVSKPKTAPPPSKPKVVKPATKPAPPSETKPKSLPSEDRTRLLNLMREPKDP